ncbi:MAG: putative inorganic carbon transporter subunit DabA, partial [Planctomycetaceae bacterium]
MQDANLSATAYSLADRDPSRLEPLLHAIEHAAHVLPTQGPITVFVHHNTLHPYEDLTFDQAVKKGEEIYGCQPFLSESRYRQEFAHGRIRQEDLTEVLLEDLKDNAEIQIGGLVSRYRLRQMMLHHDFGHGSDAELRWQMAETDALREFRPELSPHLKDRFISETRNGVLRELTQKDHDSNARLKELSSGLMAQFGSGPIEGWPDASWKAFSLQLLWRICRDGVHGVPADHHSPARSYEHNLRHTVLMQQATGEEIDQQVNSFLIRFCAAFLDQGFSTWMLPRRDVGFFQSFILLYDQGLQVHRWWRHLARELKRIEAADMSTLESIEESLSMLGVARSEREEYITQTLLALRGWAGMLWQMETNAEWTLHPAPSGSLVGFLAARLILERLALQQIEKETWGSMGELSDLRQRLKRKIPHKPRVSVDRRAFVVFQLSQILGLNPIALVKLTKDEWTQIIHEIEEFSEFERRRMFHLAYERHYRDQILDAVLAHGARPPQSAPAERSFQLISCIDDREESFRRHIEEIEPRCETFGAPGFFAVAMYYRGASDAHFRPLCPVIIKPKHYVREEVAYSLAAGSRQRAETRRVLGAASHRWYVGSRSFTGGIVTGLLGSLASIPLVARVLFPRLTARLHEMFGNLLRTPPVTELRVLREADPPGPGDEHLGYSLYEMVN